MPVSGGRLCLAGLVVLDRYWTSEAVVAFVPCCRQRIPVQLHRDDLRVFGNLALAL